MADPHGSFIWYELLTSDVAAAGRFYGGLLGWTSTPFGGEGPDYQVLTHGKAGIGGMMQAPDGMAPTWLGYIAVADVDATVAAILADGGAVRMPAEDMPNVGRIALVADPQGAPFYVMRGASDRASEAYDRNAIGHCAWNELSAAEAKPAIAFYSRHFGWTQGEAFPMGAMGDYQLMERAGAAFGAILPRPTPMPPAWTFYFRVPGIDTAAQRIRDSGGAVLHGPMEVPGEDWILAGTDPQGAAFALIGKPG